MALRMTDKNSGLKVVPLEQRWFTLLEIDSELSDSSTEN